MSETISTTQTVALVRELGGEIEFVHDYPVPEPRQNEVLAKILYTGVCQSGEPRLFSVVKFQTFGYRYLPQELIMVHSRRPAYRTGNCVWCGRQAHNQY